MGMNRTVYSYLLKTYGRRPRWWLGVTALICQTLLLRVVSVIFIARIVTDIASGDFDSARTNIIIQGFVVLAGLGFRLAKEILCVRAENDVYRDRMVIYYKRLIGKDMSFFRDHQTGYLASTFRQHTDSGMELARMFRGELIQTPISLTIPTIVLFIASWKVGLAALGVVLAQLVYVFWSSATVNAERARSHEIYRRISGAVSDDVTNAVAFKTSGFSNEAVGRMQALAYEETTTYWRRHKKHAILDAPREAITIVGASIAYWIIASNVESTATSVGLVVLTVTYMFQIFQNVSVLPELITRHDDLVTKLYPTMAYLTEDNEKIRDPKNPQKLTVDQGAIDMDHVSFSYKSERGQKIQVFDRFDLHIKGGEQVGVVGLSGAGKSTLASLLLRFDDIDGGAIRIDGTDIRDVRQDDLRSHIAYVPQEPLLFHRSIKENLQYSGDDDSDQHMIRAAKAAHANEFIAKLPDGYDTMVGERGIKLSGGQKQRIVIARAILKNAAIMLFDEATSALDSESEKIIQKALPEIIGKRTAIVIAHRLSTVASLDRIIVMHDGKIIEEGTHDQLLKLKGRYHSLWQKQTNHDS